MLIFYSVVFLHSMELQMLISTLPISCIAQQYYHQDTCISALLTGQEAPNTTGIMLVAEDNYLLFRLIITGR